MDGALQGEGPGPELWGITLMESCGARGQGRGLLD